LAKACFLVALASLDPRRAALGIGAHETTGQRPLPTFARRIDVALDEEHLAFARSFASSEYDGIDRGIRTGVIERDELSRSRAGLRQERDHCARALEGTLRELSCVIGARAFRSVHQEIAKAQIDRGLDLVAHDVSAADEETHAVVRFDHPIE